MERVQNLQRIGVVGEMTFSLRGKDGAVKKLWNENFLGKFLRKLQMEARIPFITGKYGEKMVIKNLITNAGLAELTNLMGNVSSPVAFTYLAVGVGTTAADATDTTLETEITDSGLARAAATVTQEQTTVANDTLQLVKTWNVTGTKAVTEAGAFNDASAGDLLGHQVFSAINVVNGDSLQITYKFSVAGA